MQHLGSVLHTRLRRHCDKLPCVCLPFRDHAWNKTSCMLYLKDEILAKHAKVDLTKAGHALHMTHEAQQVRQQLQEDAQDD